MGKRAQKKRSKRRSKGIYTISEIVRMVNESNEKPLCQTMEELRRAELPPENAEVIEMGGMELFVSEPKNLRCLRQKYDYSRK